MKPTLAPPCPRRAGWLAIPESITATASVTANAMIRRDNRWYPEPPSDYRRTDLGDRIVERVRRVRDREAEVPAAAYRVLTEIEEAFGGSASGSGRRDAAAFALGVEPAVLPKPGELTARNDPDIGRKAGGPSAPPWTRPAAGGPLAARSRAAAPLIPPQPAGAQAASRPLSAAALRHFQAHSLR